MEYGIGFWLAVVWGTIVLGIAFVDFLLFTRTDTWRNYQD